MYVDRREKGKKNRTFGSACQSLRGKEYVDTSTDKEVNYSII